MTGIIIIDSAFTDVLIIVLVLAFIEFIGSPMLSIAVVLNNVIGSFSIGAVMGGIIGIAWLYALRWTKETETLHGHSYVMTFGIALGLFAFVSLIEGNAAMSILAFGLVLGNSVNIGEMLRLKERIVIPHKVKEFNTLIAFFVKVFFFTFMGLFIIFEPLAVAVGIITALGILAMRPLAVRLSTHSEDITPKERKIMSVLIPRGLSSAVMAFIAAEIILLPVFTGMVFVAIVATIVITSLGFFVFSRIDESKIEGLPPAVSGKTAGQAEKKGPGKNNRKANNKVNRKGVKGPGRTPRTVNRKTNKKSGK